MKIETERRFNMERKPSSQKHVKKQQHERVVKFAAIDAMINQREE
jgi:hypothetical protein